MWLIVPSATGVPAFVQRRTCAFITAEYQLQEFIMISELAKRYDTVRAETEPRSRGTFVRKLAATDRLPATRETYLVTDGLRDVWDGER